MSQPWAAVAGWAGVVASRGRLAWAAAGCGGQQLGPRAQGLGSGGARARERERRLGFKEQSSILA